MKTGIVNQTQSEIMHLRATIAVLREQLETLSFEKDKGLSLISKSTELSQEFKKKNINTMDKTFNNFFIFFQ